MLRAMNAATIQRNRTLRGSVLNLRRARAITSSTVAPHGPMAVRTISCDVSDMSSGLVNKIPSMAITSKKAEEIEARLRELGISPADLHDWVMRRISQADENDRRITRVRMLRGSHGVSYVYDPEGTDELPPGHEQPSRPLEVAQR